MSMRTAAVIGCGPAGMAMATRLRQKGCMVTCFDIAPDAGGMWNGNGLDNFTSRGLLSPIYSSMRCVLPKDLMSFSDIRMDFTAPQFPHHSFVRRYLHRYAEMKGIRAITRFNTKVESCRHDEAQDQWKLITVNIVSNDIHEWSFDRVVVCTGQHHSPRFPDRWKEQLSGFLEAGGEVVHSAHLKHFRGLHGKHVVVVGDGVGAYDCMRELLRNGAKVTHSSQLQLQDDDANLVVGPSPSPPKATSSVEEGGGLASLNGRAKATTPPSHVESKRRFDFLSSVPRFLRRIVGLRNGEHHAHELIAKWLRFQNKEILRVPRVGKILHASGKQIVCDEDGTRQRKREDVLGEALQRGHVNRTVSSHRTVPSSGSEAAQQQRQDGEDGSSCGPDQEAATTLASSRSAVAEMLEEVDVVVFATGYTLQFPFLHDDLRSVVEGRTPPLQIGHKTTAGNSNGDDNGSNDAATECDVVMHARGLYLGTLLAANPSIAFIGTQRDLLPPFMMMEAQASFVANAFTGRVQLPQAEEGMLAYERELLRRNPELRSIYSDRGVGLHSATYFNVLHEELGILEGRATYTSQLSRRRWWVLVNWLLLAVHKLRSLAPLKRKHQHLLFSNKV